MSDLIMVTFGLFFASVTGYAIYTLGWLLGPTIPIMALIIAYSIMSVGVKLQ
jgi:hypothetical protein